jgi:hypothetical protein
MDPVIFEKSEYGQVPEPEMPWFVGLPLFLDVAGSGKAAVPFAIRPLLAWMYATASSIDRCSMWSMRELIAWIASFATSGFLYRKSCVAMGVSEKKIGTNPEAKDPSKKSALRGKDPKRTETALSPLKYFLFMLLEAVGRLWISKRGAFSSSMAMAQRMHAPGGLESVAEEEEGGLSWLMTNSLGTNCPSPSVTGMVPCLINIMSKQEYRF